MAEDIEQAVKVNRAETLEGFAHGFLGRRGGVSKGAIAGLNTGPGSGDNPEAIAENRARAIEAVSPGARLVSVYQVHSPDCVIVEEPWEESSRPEADALVTARPGLVLGVLTADCAPVLLADPVVNVVGAAHAGWKGAISGVTDRTIEAMETLGASAQRIVAAVGPCIAQQSYEVDEAFRDRFVDNDAENSVFFAGGAPGHHQFDLEGYVAMRLRAARLASVETLGMDTYAQSDRFFSYRRAAHLGQPGYGRQISLIAAN